MTTAPALDRRNLARELSRSADASVAESLARLPVAPTEGRTPLRRIGITGPPGAGKSTLIGRLAKLRVGSCGPLAVIAVDPSSPKTSGSLLGDRIRMDALLAESDIYIRSLPSGRSADGLSDNLADVLATVEAHGFAEMLLETVGVGQAEYGSRILVDTLVLVLGPNSGDQVQAMKAGVIETADIVVVNKSDQPGAERMAQDIRSVLQWRAPAEGERVVPVILTAANDAGSIAALSAEIDAHTAWLAPRVDPARMAHARALFHARALLHRRVAELANALPVAAGTPSVRQLYSELIRELARDQ